MQKWLKVSVAILFVVIAASPAKVMSADVSAEICGIRIVGPGIGEGHKALRPFNWSEGTTIVLLLKRQAGGIVRFNKDASKLNKFIDSKGVNLTEAKKKKTGFSFSRSGFGSFPRISGDGKACMIEIDAPRVPSKGATSISLEGTIELKCASSSKKFEQKNVAMQKGSLVKAGKITFTIKETGKPKWGDAKMSITLNTTDDLSSLKEIKFVGPDGKNLDVRRSSTMTMGKRTDISYNSKQMLKNATVVIECYTDMKTINVPFNQDVTVGIGK